MLVATLSPTERAALIAAIAQAMQANAEAGNYPRLTANCMNALNALIEDIK